MIKSSKKQKDKTIYFSKVVLDEHEEINILNEKRLITFYNSLETAFSSVPLNTHIKERINETDYIFNLFQKDERYFLFSISNSKEFNDILAEPIETNTQQAIKKKNMMLRYYTFVLADTKAKIIAYLNNRNLPNINSLLNIFLINKSKMNLYIEPLKNPKIGDTIKKSLKNKELFFTLNTTFKDTISNTLDETCNISRNSDLYKIKISVKNPSNELINSFLENREKVIAFQSAKLNIVDENNFSQVVDIFSTMFSYKTSISIEEIDLEHNEKIKMKLINAISSLANSF